MKQLIKHSAYFTIIAAMTLVLTLIYWSVIPSKVLTFNQPKALVVPTTIKPGDTIDVTIDYCKHVDAQAVLQRELVIDDNSYHLDLGSVDSHVAAGCHVVTLKVKIPDITRAGIYCIHFKMKYDLNPIRSEEYTYDSEYFKVTSR